MWWRNGFVLQAPLLHRTLDRNPENTVCPTRYRTRHFFNNSNTNKDANDGHFQHML
jgi:hypothetical protein